MKRNWNLEVIALVSVLAFVLIFLAVSSTGNHEFSGSDDVGSDKVAELSGRPADSYAPLIPQYEPPSGEIEATLFALQASAGGVMIGLVFGYWLGQKGSPARGS